MIKESLVVGTVIFALTANMISAAEAKKNTGFGGPEAVDNRITKDKKKRDFPFKISSQL